MNQTFTWCGGAAVGCGSCGTSDTFGRGVTVAGELIGAKMLFTERSNRYPARMHVAHAIEGSVVQAENNLGLPIRQPRLVL